MGKTNLLYIISFTLAIFFLEFSLHLHMQKAIRAMKIAVRYMRRGRDELKI